jgi:hypothetical protein
MGLVVFGAIGLYLLISIAVVIGAISYARKHGKSAIRWGSGAALVMYLLVFWDHIPTVVAHRYYCEKEAGFWVYKTLDQWKAENPGVMETLPTPSKTGSPTRYEAYDDGHGKRDTYLLNDRFNWIVSQQDKSILLPVIRTEHEVKDIKKNEILARYVDFSTGNSVKDTVGPPGPLKFWLSNRHCLSGGNNQDALRNFRDNFYGSKK